MTSRSDDLTLAELMRDAARYRFLREFAQPVYDHRLRFLEPVQLVYWSTAPWSSSSVWMRRLDAALDEQIERAGGQQQFLAKTL